MIKVTVFDVGVDEDVAFVRLDFHTKSVKDLDEAIDRLLAAKRSLLEYEKRRIADDENV